MIKQRMGSNRSAKNPSITTAKKPPFYKREWFWGYVFIAPTCVGLIIFYVYPILYSLFLSFTSWDGSSALKMVGFANFGKMFHDVDFLLSMRNTFIYALFVVPIGIALSVCIAVLLNSKIKGKVTFRAIFFLPSLTMPIAIGVVWKWIFNGENGLLNYLLSCFGLHGPNWISDPRFMLTSVIIVAIWAGIGYNMVIFSGWPAIHRANLL